MTTNVLVTGAKGFIGTNLIKCLKEQNEINIICFNRQHTLDDLEEFLAKSDFIFHFAGEVRPLSSDKEFYNSHVGLTNNIINFLEKNKKSIPIVLTSSIHAKLLKNEYGKTKRESEILIEKYSVNNNIPAIIYRLPHVFGEGCKPNYNSIISTWIYNSINNLEINIFDRDIKMSYTYVQDFINELIILINKIGDYDRVTYVVPKKVYETTLGEVVDFIDEFKVNINNKNYKIYANDFKEKLFNTYKNYFSKVDNAK